jgi:hypothetical protein
MRCFAVDAGEHAAGRPSDRGGTDRRSNALVAVDHRGRVRRIGTCPPSAEEGTMAFDPDDIRANREYFAEKLKAEKQRNDVLKAAEAAAFDFVLLDTRGNDAFASGHIPGAWSVPPSDVERIIPLLPTDRELVTYCWGHD